MNLINLQCIANDRMDLRRNFFIWFLPLAFAVNSLISFEYPGGEYAIWAAGSFPGVWVPLLNNSGDIREMRFPVAIGGALIMVFLGWRLDKSRMGKLLWVGSVLSVPALWICLVLLLGEPLKAKPDYLFGLIGFGLWFGTLLSFVVGFVAKNWGRTPDNAGQPDPGS